MPVDLKPWFLTLDDIDGPFNWPEFFGNSNPVELEVGTGRGLFLLNASQAHPERNYLGIELDYKHGRYAAGRYQRRNLPNVRLLGGDARVAITKFLPDRSVVAVHVYFPDPWWKRRHRRRRIFDAWFVEQAARMLVPGGDLHAWTDVEEYFDVMCETVAGNPDFTPLPEPAERAAEHDLDYHTNFERKKRQAGFPIYRAHWRRKDV
jgi:tRNA (guanine-N7-)-methyltransferase